MNLIGLKELSKERILQLVELSRKLTPQTEGPYFPPPPFRNALAGLPVALLFFEPSTRTRSSFELAVQHLGGYPLCLPLSASSVKKGETPLDTCMNLWAMGVQGFVVRHKSAEVLDLLAEKLPVPLINAGAGHSEHPTQALLDIRTLQDALGCQEFNGKKIAIVGDIVHSRVARSNAIGLGKLGAEVILAGPEQLLPLENERAAFEGARFVTSRSEAVREADAVMVLRIQKERFESFDVDVDQFVADWRVDQSVLDNEMRPGTPIMHPGPVVRGEELTDDVVDGPNSLVLKQVRNGVAVRQAVLFALVARHLHDDVAFGWDGAE